MNQYSNLTNVLYVGKVSFKLKIKDRIVEYANHNKGLPALQRAFCNLITGNRITNTDVPQFMDVRYSLDGGATFPTENSILLNKLPLSGKSWEEGQFIYTDESEENVFTAKLTAVLSSNSLKERISSDDQSRLYRIYLISGTNGTINGEVNGYFDMAYLDISAESLSLVMPGTQAIIEWSLQLLTGGDE